MGLQKHIAAEKPKPKPQPAELKRPTPVRVPVPLKLQDEFLEAKRVAALLGGVSRPQALYEMPNDALELAERLASNGESERALYAVIVHLLAEREAGRVR